MRRLTIILSCLLSFAALGPPPRWQPASPGARAAAQSNPGAARIRLEPVVTGLSQPVLITSARDGSNRLFIVERAGAIKVLQPGASQPTLFLDITPKVIPDRLGGLLGLAFHPQFRSNGRFFVHYVRRADNAIVIAEYGVSRSDPNVALSDEVVLIEAVRPPDSHNGGSIEFGPDGYFYVGIGDGSPANDPDNRAQNLGELFGKILRIDVDGRGGSLPYSSPESNPFYGPAPGRDEIYAYGFRNPYRFSFDRETGRLYVGDVGETMMEEVDIVTPGTNYGWRVFEGTLCTTYTPGICNTVASAAPIVEYEHRDGRCSITGGYVYRGSRSSLPGGAYLFGDLCTGEMFLLEDGRQELLLDTDLLISSFGEDAEGELYVVSLSGSIFRVAAAPTPPPSDVEEPSVQIIAPNTPVKLRGNSVYNITWNATGAGLYRQDVQFSADGGSSWQDVTLALPGAATSYAWTVPNLKTKRSRIRVIAYGSSRYTGQAMSEANFKIVKAKN